MTILNLKNIISNFVTYNLNISNNLNNEQKKQYKEIIDFINKDNILDVINEIKNAESREDYFVYNYYINKIVEDKKWDFLTISLLLKSNLNVDELDKTLWDKLSFKEKINYLENEKKIDNKLLELINKDKDVIKYILKSEEMLCKLEPMSLSWKISKDDLNDIDIFKEVVIDKLDNEMVSYVVQQKYFDFTVFEQLIRKNAFLVRHLAKYSLVFKDINHEKLVKLLNDYPLLLTKLDTPILLKELTKEEIENWDNTIRDAEIKETILELKIAKNIGNLEDNIVINELLNYPNYSLSIYPIDRISPSKRDAILNNYELLSKFKLDNIVIIVNNYFTEEEKISLLRREDFIRVINPELLEIILNNLSFKGVFNMLQNKEILNKVHALNVIIDSNEKIFITGYLDSPSLVLKANHLMIKEMLTYINDKEEALKYLKKPYINRKLTSKEIIDILIKQHLKITEIIKLDDFKNKLSTEDMVSYVNLYWLEDFDLSILKNEELFKKIFNLNDEDMLRINIEEVNYLVELINTRSILSIQKAPHDVLMYRAIIASYLLLGVNGTKELMEKGNKNLSLKKINEWLEKMAVDSSTNFKINNANILDNLSNRVRIELDKNKDTSNINELIVKNWYLRNVYNLMNESGYAKDEDIAQEFNEYLEYQTYNNYQAKKELFDYCQNFLNYLNNKEEEKTKKDFRNRILKNFKVKENVLYNHRRKMSKKIVKDFEYNLLYDTLKSNNPTKYLNYYKNIDDIGEIETNLRNTLSNEEFGYDEIFSNILRPLAKNNFLMKLALEKLGFNEPDYYQLFNKIENEKAMISKLNNELDGLKTRMSPNEYIKLLDYLCYGIETKLPEDNDNLVKIRDYLVNLFGKVEVDKVNLRIHYNYQLGFSNIKELGNYQKQVKTVKKIMYKLSRFVSKYMDEEQVKNNNLEKLTIELNKLPLDFEINESNYELKKRLFCLDDFKRVFRGYDLKSKINGLNQVFKDNQILEMVADGYLEEEDNWGEIISNWKQYEALANNLNYDIKDMDWLDLIKLAKATEYAFDPIGLLIPKEVVNKIRDEHPNDSHETLKKTNELFNKMQFRNSGTIPEVEGYENGIYYRLVSYHEPTIFNTQYSLNTDNEEYLKYVALNENGFMFEFKNYLTNEIVASLTGVRNGNTLFLCNLKLNMYDEIREVNQAIKGLAKQIMAKTSETKEPLNYVVLAINNYNKEWEVNVDSNLIPWINKPIENNIKANNVFNEEQGVLVAANLSIERANFKEYEPEITYDINKLNYIVISSFGDINDIKKINAFLYKYSLKDQQYNYEPIDINQYKQIYLGDNFLITIDLKDKVKTYVLNKKAEEIVKKIISNKEKKEDLYEDGYSRRL